MKKSQQNTEKNKEIENSGKCTLKHKKEHFREEVRQEHLIKEKL